jgi:hypothetical protein
LRFLGDGSAAPSSQRTAKTQKDRKGRQRQKELIESGISS